MKNSILIFSTVLIAFSLTAFGCVNSEEETSCCNSNDSELDGEEPRAKQVNPDFVYNVGSRFRATITKEKLLSAKTIVDLVPNGATEGLDSFQDVKISALRKDGERNEIGINTELNSAQIKLLESFDYSTNFYIEADCKHKNPETGEIERYHFVYYVTIVPENEAEYKDGQLALMNYLKENSWEETVTTKKEHLKPGRVLFTVTQSGKIANVKLESTSGYTTIDKKMIKLIKALPGEWIPATNSNGEKVSQELVFSFGIIGC